MAKLDDLCTSIDEQIQLRDPQPFLDIQRCKRKLQDISGFFHLFRLMSEDESFTGDMVVNGESKLNTLTEDTVRWIEKISGRNRVPTSALTMAPVEVGPVLREQLFKT